MSAPPALTIEVLAGSRAGERLTVALPCTIGRAPDTGVVLNDAHLSSVHGRIELTEGAVLFSDRGSTNGSVHVRSGMVTPLNSECPVVEVWTGDELHLGDPAQPVVLRVTLAEANPGEILAVRPIAEVEAFQQRVTADAERLQVLYRHTAELSRQTDVDGVLTLAARLIFDLLPRATHVAVALRERGGHFPVALARSRNGDPVALPVSRTLIRKVVEERAGLLLSDAGAEVSARSVAQAGLLSTLCVPLWTGSDVRGAIQVDNRDAPGLFGGADLEVLTVAAAQISFAAENARLVARLRLAEQKLEGENRFLKKREEDATFGGIVGRSAGINNVLRALEKVRDTRVPVLINGETGTGKELVARALHYTSARREKLFVAQNCSALPENLLESELFGHVRGAFTGADRDKKGLFELSDGGTMFLDEVGEMPLSLQAKLLRVLQEGEIWPVGAGRARQVDVRIVSATHRDLEKMVRTGGFRQDLFYRLHVFPLHMPSLRERRDDVPILARHFLERYARELGRSVTGFTPQCLERMAAYDWPGNVRELQNEIQRLLIFRSEGDLVQVEDLSPRILGESRLVDDGDIPRGNLKEMMDAVERVLLSRTLREHGHNKTRAAEVLGITREGLHKKLARFGMAE
jgi:transcriptional regulator with GAF, ATPase, and Fis domain